MKKTAAFLVILSAASFAKAAPLTDEPLPELQLGSGKVLKLALARSYSATAVLVKHADGATAVKYEEFPAEFRESLSAKRLLLEEEFASAPKRESQSDEVTELLKVSYDFPAPPALEEPKGSETVISGQVFVSTPDAGNLKLGGVKVSVYSKSDYRKQAAWYFANPWEASRTRTRNAEILMKAGNLAAATAQFEAATEAASIGWQLVTPAQFSTKTDADGRFTLKHRIAPPYFVVAHGSRVVDGEIENYRWAVISDLIEEPGNLLLFNENME